MYINIITNTYPVSEGEIRSLHPDTSFPQPFTPPDGYVWVFPAPIPAHDSVTQAVREATAVLTNKGHWEQVWEVTSLSTEVVEANQAARALQIKANIVVQTQARLDAFAQTREYDDIKSASTYSGCSVTKFDVEGTYCKNIRAETWNVLFNLLGEVEAGTRPAPTSFADVEPLLPPLAWPN